METYTKVIVELRGEDALLFQKLLETLGYSKADTVREALKALAKKEKIND